MEKKGEHMSKLWIWILVVIVILSLGFWIYYIISGIETDSSLDDEPPEPIAATELEDLFDCSVDSYNCADFTTCEEVMEVFEECSNDVHRLDNNRDGVPCENLCA